MKLLVLGFFVFAVLLVDLESNAQGFGLRAGFQAAYTQNNGNEVDGSLDHFYLGAFKNRKLGVGDLLTLNTGLEYMQNGHRRDDSNFRRMNYLSIPVGLRVKIGPVFAQGGFNGNFKISERYEVNGVDALDSNNKTKTFDLPAHIGLGIKLFALEIEARYHHGFMDVNNGNKNSYLQIGAAIAF